MKALSLVLALALALPAYAADDAPVVTAGVELGTTAPTAPVAPEASDAPVVMKAGDTAPVSGVLLPDALAVTRAKELAALRVENVELKAKPEGVSVPVVVVLVLSGVALGAAAGAGVALATAPK